MNGTGYQYDMQCTQLFWVPLNGGLCYYDQTSGNRVHIRLTYLDRISVRRVEFHFKTQLDSVRVYWTCVTRNSQGVEACNSVWCSWIFIFASAIFGTSRKDQSDNWPITDQSNLVNDVTLFYSSLKSEFALLTSYTFQPLMSFWWD